MSNIAFVIMVGPSYESSVAGVITDRGEAIDVCERLNTECGESAYYVDEFSMGVVEVDGDTPGDPLISGYSTWDEYDEAVVADARYREGCTAREQADRDKEFTREIVEAFDKERAKVREQEIEETALVKSAFHLVKSERGASKARKRAAASLRNETSMRFNAKYSEIRGREIAAIDAALAERDAGSY